MDHVFIVKNQTTMQRNVDFILWITQKVFLRLKQIMS